jgi:hypothetical protein
LSNYEKIVSIPLRSDFNASGTFWKFNIIYVSIPLRSDFNST